MESGSINAVRFGKKYQESELPENATAAAIIDAALKVHRELGPGMLESVYESALAYELVKRGFTVRRQVPVEVVYDGLVFEEGFRLDLLVQEEVIVEIKAAAAISPTHLKTVLTYLRFSKKKLGLILNFNEAVLKHGIKRVVNGL